MSPAVGTLGKKIKSDRTRVFCIANEAKSRVCNGKNCEHDDLHWMVLAAASKEWKFQSEEDLVKYYIDIVADTFKMSYDNAQDRIYVVSCGYGYGFCVKLDGYDMCHKLEQADEVLMVVRDCSWKTRKTVQPVEKYIPLNKDDQLASLFSFYHLSKIVTPKFRDDIWLIYCLETRCPFVEAKEHHANCSSFDVALLILAKAIGGSVSLGKVKSGILMVWHKAGLPLGYAAMLRGKEVTYFMDLPKEYHVLPLPIDAFNVINTISSSDRGIMHIYPGDKGVECDLMTYKASLGFAIDPHLHDMYTLHYLWEATMVGKYRNWAVHMKEPIGGFQAKADFIQLCLNLLQKSMPSEENVGRKIHIVWLKWPYGFCAQIDEDTANVIRDMHQVVSVLPVYYFATGEVLFSGPFLPGVDLEVIFDPVTEDGDPRSLEYVLAARDVEGVQDTAHTVPVVEQREELYDPLHIPDVDKVNAAYLSVHGCTKVDRPLWQRNSWNVKIGSNQNVHITGGSTSSLTIP